MKYRAVNESELISTLGVRNCSPDGNKAGYVIGPAISGRICHIASCCSMADAKRIAAKLNKESE